MQCAVCRNTTLQAVELEDGLAAQSCPQNHGIWLGSATYFAWLEQRERVLEETSTDDDLADVVEPETAKICPECRHILLRYNIGHKLTFALDHCDNCNGVWFDTHEWEQIRSRNLHDKIHRMFGPAWQRQVWIEQRREARAHIYLEKLGEADYSELKRIKTWLSNHPQQTLLQAFLNDPDPYSP